MNEVKEEFILIPPEKLSEDVLDALIEEFILREGTDYGHGEKSLDQKKESVKKQLATKRICIVYSQLTENTSLLLKSELPKKTVI